MNKTKFCVRTLELLSRRPEVLELLDRIVVVDQGSEYLRDAEGIDGPRSRLGGQLQIIEQENLGGSGGFARSTLAALDSPDSTAVFFLDDDVRIEPDSILRAVRFSQYTKSPTIVGGHMLDLSYPTALHSWAERVDPANSMWGPSVKESERHDFAETPLDETPWAHREAPTDYNGWFMCLIPRSVIEQIGLPAPFFIKWDDSEYGLRAKAAGVPTSTVPGVALWHVSWLDKNDSVDWQAYFHTRNRVITALLHSTNRRGGLLLRDLRRHQLKQLLSMEYYAVGAGTRGLKDVLSGPQILHDSLGTTLALLRGAAAKRPETQVVDTGKPARIIPPRELLLEAGPSGPRLLLFTAKAVMRHLLRPSPPCETDTGPVQLPAEEGRWWHLPDQDDVLVESRSGTHARRLRRDRRLFIQLWARSLWLNARLWWQWSQLSRTYQQSWSERTSEASWRETTGA